MRILIVEDERKLAASLRKGLTSERYSVNLAHTGEEGFYLATTESFDLVLLDVVLHGRDGLEILRTLRQRGLACPVLALTSRDGIQDRVRGLDAGADDYLVKPFAFPELLARIRALTRRGNSIQSSSVKLADLEMNVEARTVFRGGKEISLTVREFALLEYLLRQPGRVISREMLRADPALQSNIFRLFALVSSFEFPKLSPEFVGTSFRKALLSLLLTLRRLACGCL